MDIDDNLSSECNAPKGNTQTRLQKCAPAALELGTIKDLDTSGKRCAIPLLSPLVLSPQPPLEAIKELIHENKDNNLSVRTITVGGGWAHPAVGKYPEPTFMFDIFQSQCALKDRAQ